MKFQVSFKTPDALDHALEQVAYDPEGSCDCGGGCIDCDRAGDYAREAQAEIEACAKKFVRYGECITIEFCTETNTAKVVPV